MINKLFEKKLVQKRDQYIAQRCNPDVMGNLGATCYIDSVLFALLYNPTNFITKKTINYDKNRLPEDCKHLVDDIRVLAETLNYGQPQNFKSCNVKNFLKSLEKCSKEKSGLKDFKNIEEDVLLFFMAFINIYDNNVFNKDEKDNINYLISKKEYHGRTTENDKWTSFRETRYEPDSLIKITVDPDGNITSPVQQAINGIKEILEETGRIRDGPRIQRETSGYMLESEDIDFLSVHVKRERTYEKNKKFINQSLFVPNETISIPIFGEPNKRITFAVDRIIIKIGGVEGGHYVTMYKCDIDGKWYYYNDVGRVVKHVADEYDHMLQITVDNESKISASTGSRLIFYRKIDEIKKKEEVEHASEDRTHKIIKNIGKYTPLTPEQQENIKPFLSTERFIKLFDTFGNQKNPRKYREKFVKTLFTILNDANTDSYQQQNPQKGIILLKKLLGDGFIQYTQALNEESQDPHYIKAVLAEAMYITPQDGKKFNKKIVLWVGGPSASGKTTAAKYIINKLIYNNNIPDNHFHPDKGINTFLFIDGGIERKVSQMRQLVLQTALAKGYRGIRDLETYWFKPKIKNIIKELGDQASDINLVIPNTFPKLYFDENIISKYSKDPNVNQYYSQIIAKDKKDNTFKFTIEEMGTVRAFRLPKNAIVSSNKINDIKLNNLSIGVESKEYNRKGFDIGVKNSQKALEKYVKSMGDEKKTPIYIAVMNDLIRTYQNDKTKQLIKCKNNEKCPPDNDIIIISQQLYDKWNKTLPESDVIQWRNKQGMILFSKICIGKLEIDKCVPEITSLDEENDNYNKIDTTTPETPETPETHETHETPEKIDELTPFINGLPTNFDGWTNAKKMVQYINLGPSLQKLEQSNKEVHKRIQDQEKIVKDMEELNDRDKTIIQKLAHKMGIQLSIQCWNVFKAWTPSFKKEPVQPHSDPTKTVFARVKGTCERIPGIQQPTPEMWANFRAQVTNYFTTKIAKAKAQKTAFKFHDLQKHNKLKISNYGLVSAIGGTRTTGEQGIRFGIAPQLTPQLIEILEPLPTNIAFKESSQNTIRVYKFIERLPIATVALVFSEENASRGVKELYLKIGRQLTDNRWIKLNQLISDDLDRSVINELWFKNIGKFIIPTLQIEKN